MRNLLLPTLAVPLLTLTLAACQRKAEEPAAAPAAMPAAAAAPAAPVEAAPAPAVDNTALVAAISVERERIEGIKSTLTKKIVPFDNARAQFKQKWKKMDVYSEGAQVVRIKTYPQGSSKRTEEFYFKDGALALAFIEDEGLGNEGKDESPKGKTYWFSGGQFISEKNDTGEVEVSAPADDAARLQQEAREYLELAAKP